MYIKQWLENYVTIHYKRYVDDILIIFDQNRTNEKTIINYMIYTDKKFEFKISEEEENNSIKYLVLSIHRNANNIDL
jgi:hypothetical protein